MGIEGLGAMRIILKLFIILFVFCSLAVVSSAQTKTPILTTPLIDLGRDEVARDRFKVLKVVADTVATETKQLEEDVKQRRQELEEIMLCGQYGMLRVPADGELKSWKAGMQVAGTQITQAMCAPALVERREGGSTLAEGFVNFTKITGDGSFSNQVNGQDAIALSATNSYLLLCSPAGFKILGYTEVGSWQALADKNTGLTEIAPLKSGRTVSSCFMDGDLAVIGYQGAAYSGFTYAVVEPDGKLNIGHVNAGTNLNEWATEVFVQGDYVMYHYRHPTVNSNFIWGIEVFERVDTTSFQLVGQGGTVQALDGAFNYQVSEMTPYGPVLYWSLPIDSKYYFMSFSELTNANITNPTGLTEVAVLGDARDKFFAKDGQKVFHRSGSGLQVATMDFNNKTLLTSFVAITGAEDCEGGSLYVVAKNNYMMCRAAAPYPANRYVFKWNGTTYAPVFTKSIAGLHGVTGYVDDFSQDVYFALATSTVDYFKLP